MCVNPSHLYEGSHADNMADMAYKGRHVALRGATNSQATITEDIVRAIRALGGSCSQQKIADQFGIHQAHVSRILLRKSWAHVD